MIYEKKALTESANRTQLQSVSGNIRQASKTLSEIGEFAGKQASANIKEAKGFIKEDYKIKQEEAKERKKALEEQEKERLRELKEREREKQREARELEKGRKKAIAEANKQRLAEEKAQLKQAGELALNQSKLETRQSLFLLSQDPKLKDNPVALEQETKKIISNNIRNLPLGDQVKVQVAVEAERQSIIQKAQNNFVKEQNDIRKNTAVQTIEMGTQNTVSNSIPLFFSAKGENVAPNVVALLQAQEEVKEAGNAQDINGKPFFSSEDKIKYRNDVNKRLLDEIGNKINSLEPQDADYFLDAIIEGKTFTVDDGNGKEQVVQLSKMFGDIYRDVVRLAQDRKKELLAKSEQYKQLKFFQDQSSFLTKPTRVGLDNLINNPYGIKITPEQQDAWERIYEKSPNYFAETKFENASEAANFLTSNFEQAEDLSEPSLQKFTLYVQNLREANDKGDISTDDMNNFIQTGYRILFDKVFKEEVDNIFGDLSFWNPDSWGIVSDGKVENIGLQAIPKTIELLGQGNVEAAKEYYNIQKKRAIGAKYGVNMSNMVPNESFFEYRGQTYLYKGIVNDDILVEIQK